MEKEDEEVPILLELQPQTETETDVDNEDEFTTNGHSKGVGWSSPLGYVRQFLKWMAIMKDTFGGPFVVFVMIVYGVTQGFAKAMKHLVSNYYWKDVQKMQPVYAQSFMVLFSSALLSIFHFFLAEHPFFFGYNNLK
ncbi:hypothetical protein SUGI_0692590 [Cryptomeria japonica]|nr:hypothetical protein SUGI_0692590 [Cryptomeria japonica]